MYRTEHKKWRKKVLTIKKTLKLEGGEGVGEGGALCVHACAYHELQHLPCGDGFDVKAWKNISRQYISTLGITSSIYS